jgi:hypothetical protein
MIPLEAIVSFGCIRTHRSTVKLLVDVDDVEDADFCLRISDDIFPLERLDEPDVDAIPFPFRQ